jgi:CRISPR-associated protein Cas1
LKQLQNVLFVTLQGAYLSKNGDTVDVLHEQRTKLRVPLHTLQSIVCFGNVSCSPFLMGACGEAKIGLSFLTENGRFLARVDGPVRGNVLLRMEQYRVSDDEVRSSVISKSIILSKIANSRVVLQRILRDYPENPGREDISTALTQLDSSLRELNRAATLDLVRGIEGLAASAYFSCLDHLINKDKENFYFKGRNRRPPLDNMNALLSFLYTLLVHDVQSALEGVGLDPAVGFLHRHRPGRPSLALDLMEELRAFLADRAALSLVNRQQVKATGFSRSESGAVTMDDDTRKVVLVAWQKRKKEEITHPFLQEKIEIGLIPHVQAMLLARFLRGDLDAYPPFLWR